MNAQIKESAMKTNLEINMLAEFGDFLADGHVGNRVMSLRVESVWDKCETIFFDFAGVHNITDSFVHATFGNMPEDHGDDFMNKTRPVGSNTPNNSPNTSAAKTKNAPIKSKASSRS
jgi:STAS-like domain of unknown function (DUF4325)